MHLAQANGHSTVEAIYLFNAQWGWNLQQANLSADVQRVRVEPHNHTARCQAESSHSKRVLALTPRVLDPCLGSSSG